MLGRRQAGTTPQTRQPAYFSAWMPGEGAGCIPNVAFAHVEEERGELEKRGISVCTFVHESSRLCLHMYFYQPKGNALVLGIPFLYLQKQKMSEGPKLCHNAILVRTQPAQIRNEFYQDMANLAGSPDLTEVPFVVPRKPACILRAA